MATENTAPTADQTPAQENTDLQAPVEITLPEDGSEPTVTEGAEPAQQPAATEQRSKNRVPAKKRINELWHQGQHYKSEAARLAAENETLRQQMDQERGQRKVVDTAAIGEYAKRWETEMELAKRDLTEAHTLSDPAKIADATARMSTAAAELQNINAWKSRQPAQPQRTDQPAARVEPEPEQQVEPPSPEVTAWLEDNQWFIPSSPDHDAEMAMEMVSFSGLLERKMIRQGKAAEVGSAAFFQEIDKHMRDEFPDRFDGEAEPEPAPQPQPTRRTPPMQRQNNGVAPVSRSTPAAAGAPGNRTVSLTAEERGFAHQLAANGALKYPAGHKLSGKPMAPRDAEIAFATQKLNQSR